MFSRLVFFAVALAARTALAGAVPVGLYPVQRTGASDAAMDRLQSTLKTNVSLFPDVAAFDLGTATRCTADEAQCLATAGKLAHASRVVHASVARADDGYQVRLQLIEVRTGAAREVRRHVRGGPADLLGGMAIATCELLNERTEKCVGRIAVTGGKGAHVEIDNKDFGAAPLAKAVEVAVGRHALRLRTADGAGEVKRVNVLYQETVRLSAQEGALDLFDGDDAARALPAVAAAPRKAAPVPQAPLPGDRAVPSPRLYSSGDRALRYGGLGALAAGATLAMVGGGFGLYTGATAADLQTKYDKGALTAADAPRYPAYRSAARTANWLYGTAAAFGIAGGVMLFMASDTNAGR